jgi:hypothetical protein
MKTGASFRPTQSRIDATRSRISCGSPMLRANRMKPQGRSSRKKRISSSLSDLPAQPRIMAFDSIIDES